MCGCSAKFKIGSAGTTGFSQFVAIQPLLNNNPLVTFDFAWCINPDKVKAAFKPYGLDITGMQDLQALAAAAGNGNDIKMYNVSFMNVVTGINFTQAEYENASCQILLTK